MPTIRIVAAQLNQVVGDLSGNSAKILDAYRTAESLGADLVAFPELSITGYPPEDLLLRPAFIARAAASLVTIAEQTGRVAAVIGYPELDGELFNSAAVCADGKVQGVYRKQLLPNYAVFDEQRYFAARTDEAPLFVIAGVKVGITICEDAWSSTGPIAAQVSGGAALIVNINASPFYAGRVQEREEMLSARAVEARVPIVYVNLVGGQDELVFDGASMAFDAQGKLIARAQQFREDLLVIDLELMPTDEVPRPGSRIAPRTPALEGVYEALTLGTRDYVTKNGFTKVLIGLSGGIDSSLVAAIAVDALGPDCVVGVMMPSRFSSSGSVSDAELLANNLGIETMTIPIENAHAAFIDMLSEPFSGTEPGVAEENLQARIRGTILMGISNKFGWLVLTTGNKSEMATGYSTLYGDMAGGFAVIKDVPKMLVYSLCEDRNVRAGTDLVPREVITKPPSAELRPDQRDDDSLPPYELLDAVIEGYVERDRSVDELVGEGFDRVVVERVAALVDRSEHKRRQAPPGVRVSPKAFGKDRRFPLTNRWPG